MVPAVFPGGSVDLDVCWIVDAADVDSLQAYVTDYEAEPEPETLWLSLYGAPAPGTATPRGGS